MLSSTIHYFNNMVIPLAVAIFVVDTDCNYVSCVSPSVDLLK